MKVPSSLSRMFNRVKKRSTCLRSRGSSFSYFLALKNFPALFPDFKKFPRCLVPPRIVERVVLGRFLLWQCGIAEIVALLLEIAAWLLTFLGLAKHLYDLLSPTSDLAVLFLNFKWTFTKLLRNFVAQCLLDCTGEDSGSAAGAE